MHRFAKTVPSLGTGRPFPLPCQPHLLTSRKQTVKGLSESLNETTARLAPKSRFQFKSRGTFGGGSAGAGPSKKADPARTTGDDKLGELPSRFATSSATAESKNYNDQLSRPGISGIRKPSFSTAKEIAINDHMGLHIILPSSASRATSSGKLANLARCIVDMSVPTVSGSSPFASLALRDVRKSLVVAGRVAGSVHITGVTDSVIVVQARQVRIHECKNTVFYLHCGSHPIIEDCENVKFAPMPQCLVSLSCVSLPPAREVERMVYKDDKVVILLTIVTV